MGTAWALALRNRGTEWAFGQTVRKFFAERGTSGVQQLQA
jgi:hypothetical protein